MRPGVRLMANPNAGMIRNCCRKRPVWIRCMRAVSSSRPACMGHSLTAGLHFCNLANAPPGHKPNSILRETVYRALRTGSAAGRRFLCRFNPSYDSRGSGVDAPCRLGVWIAYDLPGSMQELPPNLLDELKRDRRWCHGNLMNFRRSW